MGWPLGAGISLFSQSVIDAIGVSRERVSLKIGGTISIAPLGDTYHHFADSVGSPKSQTAKKSEHDLYEHVASAAVAI